MEARRPPAMSNPAEPPPATTTSRGAVVACFVAVCVAAVPASLLVAAIRGGVVAFDAAPLPDDYSHHAVISVAEHHRRVLRASERVGEGLLPGPEDLAYDSGAGYLYASCRDGWVRRVKLPDPEEEPPAAAAAVEDWAYVGGRPLGVVFGSGKHLLVAEAYKDRFPCTEGLPFALTDGVDVAADGAIYFTDATHKHNLSTHMLDILEGRPHGRLLRYDPATATTAVLLRDLYFANGVAVSPDQSSLVFCESLLRRCRRYHIAGEKKGTVERFMENLPGSPDNIRYDGEGHFWIALSAGKSWFGEMVLRFPWVRKVMGMAALLLQADVSVPSLVKPGGVLRASLEGEALALYTDPEMVLVTGGIKVGRYLYYGSLVGDHVGRIRLDELAAAAAAAGK